MKRKLAVLAALVLCLSMAAGCGKKPSGETEGNTGGNTQTGQEEQPGDNTKPDTENGDEGTVAFTAYVSDDEAMHLVAKEMKAKEDTAEAVVEALAKAGALPEGSRLLSCKWASEPDKQLAVDMNAAFKEGMQHTGTTGEYLCLGSLTNTLLTYFEADSLVLMVEGEVLETGHAVYDEPLTFFADEG